MSVSSAKRGAAMSAEVMESGPPARRAKAGPLSVLYSPVQQNSAAALNTTVKILAEDFEGTFGREKRFVQIARQVYEVLTMRLTSAERRQLPPHPVILDTTQYKDCKESIIFFGEESALQLIPFDPSNVSDLTTVEFELSIASTSQTVGSIVLDISSLNKMFESLQGQVLMGYQHLRLPLINCTVIAQVKEVPSLSTHSEEWDASRLGGLVTANTRFTFSTLAGSGITFLEEIHQVEDDVLQFKVTSDIRNSENSVVLNVGTLRQIVAKQIWTPGQKIPLPQTYPPIYLSLDILPQGQKPYNSGYKINSQTILQFNPSYGIFLVDAHKSPALIKKIVFRIKEFNPKKNTILHIDTEELKVAIAHLDQEWVVDQKVWVRTTVGDCLIGVSSIYPQESSSQDTPTEIDVDGEENISVRYRLNNETKMEFACNEDIKLVEPSKTLVASKVVLKVELPRRPMQILFGVESPKETKYLPEKPLQELVRKKMKAFTLGDCFSICLLHNGKSTDVNVTVLEFEAPVEEGKRPIYSPLATLAPKAEIEFKQAESSELAIERSVEDVQEPTLEDCLKLGVGGLADKMQELYLHLVAARKPYIKRRLELTKAAPDKGVLLYGPPGTGKTLLAKNMAKLLGCDGSRVRHISGADIFNKWLGDSEKNMKKLFTREEGDKSLLVIIIDEADALLNKRGGDSCHTRDAVVNQFLQGLDGAQSDPNTVVILITNRKDMIDEAVLRPGRCGLHLHIDLPNLEQRKEIFEIYLRESREEGLLHADVNSEELASRTEGCSGAFIAGMVREATLAAVKKEMRLPEQPEKSVEQVTMKDLLMAHERLLADAKLEFPKQMYL